MSHTLHNLVQLLGVLLQLADISCHPINGNSWENSLQMLHNLVEMLQLLSQLACEDKQQMAYMANCLQMMRNLVEVLRLLSTSKPSASGTGLELLLAARGSEDGAAQLPQKQSSQAYVQREADAAWDCIQVSRQPVTFACSPQGYSAISSAGRRAVLNHAAYGGKASRVQPVMSRASSFSDTAPAPTFIQLFARAAFLRRRQAFDRMRYVLIEVIP